MIGTKPATWSDQEWRTLGAMLLEGRSARAIGEALGKSRDSVLGAIHRAGGSETLRAILRGDVPLPAPPPPRIREGRTGGRGRDWTEAELATARQMRAAGRTIAAIAAALGRSRESVKWKAQDTGGFGAPTPPRRRAKPALPSAAVRPAGAAAPVSIWSGWTRAEKVAAVAAGLEAGRDSAAMAAAWGTTPAAVGSFRRDHEDAIAARLPVPLRGRVAPKKRHDLFLTEVRSDRPQPAEPEVAAEWSPPADGGVRFLDRRGDQCARLLPRNGGSIHAAMVCGRPVVGETSWCAACLPVMTRPQTVAERKEARKVERAA